MSEPTSDTTTDAPPPDLETKDLPRGYGHAGVPAPDQLGYQAPNTSAAIEVEPAPDTADAEADGQPGDNTADAGAAPGADTSAATSTA